MSIDRRSKQGRAPAACALVAAASILTAGLARGQTAPAGTAHPTVSQQPSQSDPPTAAQPPSLDDTIEAGEAEDEEPRRQLVRWNQYEGPYFTMKIGGGFLYEGAAFIQDSDSERQFDLRSDNKVRDSRLTFKGRFPRIKRPVTYTSGIMYDGPTDEWLLRETGIMIAVPEIWGHIFIGRTKEGFSLNKVMAGYSGWTMERATINDATIPILADGVKWLGYNKERGLLWNLGYFNDVLSNAQAFSTYRQQVVGRFAWLPIASEKEGKLLHLGISARYGEPEDGQLRLRSRPETYPTEYFVDTGVIGTDSTTMFAIEAYYRPGPWLFGTEYFVQNADAPESGDPLFHGGDVVVSWNITGETRVYNTRGGFFNGISPTRSVFEGGWGGWEAVARLSYIDLDGGSIRGGKFWRITPMLNWHMSDNIRWEFAYGYGVLDRFDLRGATQFFQTRVQLQF